jgi:hypothetical protein
MAPGAWFGLVVVALGGLMFAVSRPVSTASANIRVQLGQKLDKQAFVRRNVRVARIMGLSFVLIGVVIAILSETVGRG